MGILIILLNAPQTSCAPMQNVLLILCLIITPTYANVCFLSISDIHYGKDIVTKDGTDTNQILLEKALNKFSQLVKKVDFVLTLGDLPAHAVFCSKKKQDHIRTVFHDLYLANKSHKPMFYITGNNDSLQGNSLPFSWKGRTPLTLANDWQGACIYCKGLIIDGTHMQDGGYYSSYVLQGNQDIMLIALNSIQFMKIPLYMRQYPNQNKDAHQQLHWLEKQLSTHHAKQLLIAMHTPPGKDYQDRTLWEEAYLKDFISILNHTHQHYQQISLLISHTHMDDIRKISLLDGTPIYAFATPSVSPSHHNNPAIKVFDLNAKLEIQDYTTYYTSSYTEWGTDHYSARIDIFPQCRRTDLAKCFISHSTNFICKRLRDGQFYGVKSPRVNGASCRITYPVN